MLEENCSSFQKKDTMTEELARTLCRKLENGGIIRPDNCIAFQEKK